LSVPPFTRAFLKSPSSNVNKIKIVHVDYTSIALNPANSSNLEQLALKGLKLTLLVTNNVRATAARM